MIFYFTGTGNSRFVVGILAENLNDTSVSIMKFSGTAGHRTFILKPLMS